MIENELQELQEFTRYIPLVIPLLIIQLGLVVVALWDLIKREETRGPKWVWALVILFIIKVCFTVSEVFHNAMLPSIAPVNRVGLISGLAFSLGNTGGLLLMLFVLLAFAMPGTQPWSFLPEAPLFGIDQNLHEHDRIVGPIAGVWMLLFTLPLILFSGEWGSSS